MSQLPPETPAAIPNAQSAPRPGKGLAVTALVLGLIGLFPLAGVLAALAGITLGIIVLAAKKPGKGMGLTGIITGVIGIIGSIVFVIGGFAYFLTGAVGKAQTAACASNLNFVYKGIILYQQANEQAYPADFDTLIKDGQGPKLFQCPAAQRGGNGKKFDYFYLASSSVNPDSNTIIACDFKGNHPDQTRNVLYADGRVMRAPERQFQAELTQPYNAAFAAALRKAEGP